jgi:hypothetical protein
MKNESPEPRPPAPATTLPTIRHDGWTGEKMAAFCEALAETAVVAEACEAAGMSVSGAYAARRRNPVFAAAWDAALTIARERLADTLLARSMEGNVELIWRDGEVVGERHLLDNRLGLAILRRLDRIAETGMTLSTRGERWLPSARAGQDRGAPAPRSDPFDWELMVEALRTGDDDAVARALALCKSNEVEEVEDPPLSLSRDDGEGHFLDLSDRCWKDPIDDIWMTDFPPPPGFTGSESGEWGDPFEPYSRECTAEEAAALDADAAADAAAVRAEDEALRDGWFAMLRGEEAIAGAGDGTDTRKSPAAGAAGDRGDQGIESA